MPPKLEAIIFCDQVISEAGSGKVSLIGIFNEIRMGQVPAGYQFSVFCRIGDLVPKQETSLRMTIATPQGREILSGTMTFIPDNAVADIPVNQVRTKFDTFGPHQVKIFSADRFLGMGTLSVVQNAPPTKEQTP